MDNQAAKFIERIEIKGLWGRYDVDWALHQDVNILVGENGTGKSTLLLILKIVLGKTVPATKHKLLFSKEVIIHSKGNAFSGAIAGASNVLTKWYQFSPRNGLYNRYFNLNVDYISTFDSRIKEKESIKPYVESHLDQDLDDAISRYTIFQNNLFKKKENSNKTLSQVLAETNNFFEILNNLFKSSGKSFIDNISSSGNETIIQVKLIDETIVSVFNLSSGEKQLLIILLTVLCQDRTPSVLIMDEPEISLHLNWQLELIEIIRTLNPNCQVIAATHSPSIFGNGWRDKLIFMEDIIPQLQTPVTA